MGIVKTISGIPHNNLVIGIYYKERAPLYISIYIYILAMSRFTSNAMSLSI